MNFDSFIEEYHRCNNLLISEVLALRSIIKQIAQEKEMLEYIVSLHHRKSEVDFLKQFEFEKLKNDLKYSESVCERILLAKVAAGRRVIELEDKLAEQEQELFELQKEVGRSRLIESLRAGTFFKGMFLFSIIFQVSQISLRSNMV